MFKKLFIITVLTLAPWAHAHAQVVVNDALIEFKPQTRPMRNITIYNTSPDMPLNINTDILETYWSEGSRITNSTKDLIVVPSHFQLPPQSERTIRILTQDHKPTQDKAYRIRFLPQQVKETAIKPSDDQMNGTIKVQTTMGVLVITRTKTPTPNISWKRTDNNIQLTNTGNTILTVHDSKQCDYSNQSCEKIYGEILLTGETLAIDLPKKLQYEDFTFVATSHNYRQEVKVPYATY